MTPQGEHMEADPLDTVRLQLLAAARSRSFRTRRRWRQRLLLAGVLSTAVLAAGTAVAAVGDFPTGIPVIDKLLQVDGSSLGDGPGPGGATDPVEIPAGSDGLTVLAYATSSNSVCVAKGVNSAPNDQAEGALGGCLSAQSLSDDVHREGVVWATASLIGDYRLFIGYVEGSVADVRVLGSEFPTNVRLAPRWVPPGADGRGIRLLAVYDRAPAIVRSNDDPGDDDLMKLVAQDPNVEALDASGRPIAYTESARR